MTARHDHDLQPVRLLDAQATPHALRDALQALRERAPSAEAEARIVQQLGRPVQTPARISPTLIALSVLALLGALGVWAWPEHEAIRRPRSGSTAEAPGLPLPAAIEAPSAPPAPRTHREPARAEVAIAAPAAVVAAPPPVAPEPAPARHPRPVKRAKPAVLTPPAITAVVAARDGELSPTPAPAEPQAPTRKLTAPPDDTERAFADPQDEAGLLYRARRLASSDPKAALRLLVLHEASFPDGAFVQERDVLEIQIHERLGHTATAKRLAALFKQRHPESVYRVSP
jgi:hypothetical protein